MTSLSTGFKMDIAFRQCLLASLIFFTFQLLLYGCSGKSSSTTADAPRLESVSTNSLNATAKDGEIELSWNEEAGATYNLYWSKTTGVSSADNLGVFQDLSVPFFNHTALTNGDTYYYVVTATIGGSESADSREISAIPAIPSGTGFSLMGSIKYEDREYGFSGFTGVTEYKAVRYASVEVVDPSTDPDQVLASGLTDDAGVFSFNDIVSAATTIYVRVLSETSAAGIPEVAVKYTTTASLYAVGGADFAPEAGATSSLLIDIPVDSNVAGAFNILDVLTYSGEFIKAFEGSAPPLLNAYWQAGNDIGYSYFCDVGGGLCSHGVGIYVLGGDAPGSGDTDEYDDDVMIHEYGHFAAYSYSRDDSPGGPHYLNDTAQDMRLSWSEGWGNFFVSAVKSWLDTNNAALLSSATGTSLSQYVDTDDSGTYITFDIADPPWAVKYASSELAVAKVLYKTMSDTTTGMDAIWYAFADYIPNIYDASLPVNMEAMWDGWLTSETEASPDFSILLSNFTSMEIDYFRDSFEEDGNIDPARKINLDEVQVHTLYLNYSTASKDFDYVAFNANEGTEYNIRTTNLKNGADTTLQIFDPYSTAFATNDNYDGITLASKISFTAITTGVFHAEVTTSNSRPASVGRYGSYDLVLTSP